MTSITDSEALALPITRSAQEIASQFARQQPTPEKAEQVRLNTLAVCVVNDYCQMMGMPTDLTAGDSWQPLQRLGANVADLELLAVGRLECRPVQRGESTCLIPAEVWADRIGYVAVQIDEEAGEATLLGFVAATTTEAVPLHQFRSIEQLIDRIHALQTAAQTINQTTTQTTTQTAAQTAQTTNLGQWLAGQVTAGWQTIEGFLDLLNAEPAFAFRSTSVADTTIESTDYRRAKLIHLSTAEVDYPLGLVMGVMPRSDQRRSVYAQIHTIEPQTFLPESLQLAVLDQTGTVMLEAQSRQSDDYIQLRFRGLPGERFRIQIALEDTILTEDFVI